MVKFLFSDTMLPDYSLFSVINHQNRSPLPLEQLETSSKTPISTESATSQPLPLPSPPEPSRSSATASLYRQHHIQLSKHVISCKSTGKRGLNKLHEWRTSKELDTCSRQVLFYVRCHRVSLQGQMEVAKKGSHRIKRGTGGRKKSRFTFSTSFVITRLFKKRGSSEDFK